MLSFAFFRIMKDRQHYIMVRRPLVIFELIGDVLIIISSL